LECQSGRLEDSAVPVESSWRRTEQAATGPENLLAEAEHSVVGAERWSEETVVRRVEWEYTRRPLVRTAPVARQRMGAYAVGGATPISTRVVLLDRSRSKYRSSRTTRRRSDPLELAAALEKSRCGA
jgi:hypothetical protein